MRRFKCFYQGKKSQHEFVVSVTDSVYKNLSEDKKNDYFTRLGRKTYGKYIRLLKVVDLDSFEVICGEE